LGGISAAISLAQQGYEVNVFEKNTHLGGKLNLMDKEGFRFDLGPSILTMPHIFRRLYEKKGKDMGDYVKIKQLSPQWRNFFVDGTVIDLYPDPDEMVEKNPKLGEEDRKDLIEYIKYSQRVSDLTERGYFSKGLDTLWDVVKEYGPITSVRGFDYFNTMQEGINKRIRNQHLRYILGFFIKYVGSSPYDAPAVLNLLPYIQFKYGLWYVDGGMFNLSKALEKLMREEGVHIHTGREVVELEKEGDRITTAVLKDGTRVQADIFISNMEVIPAYRNLLGETGCMIKEYEKKFEPACSGYVLHLGVDRRYPQLAHHNFFFSGNPKKHFRDVFHEGKLPSDPTIYLVASSVTDPLQAPSGCENLKILPHIPHLGKNRFTSKEFQEFREKILVKLERMGLEDLRKHIIVEDEWTPQDIQKWYYSNGGAIYGVLSDKNMNKGFKAPKKSSKYSNLFFVGGSVNPGGGMPMVTLSGQQVRDKIRDSLS